MGDERGWTIRRLLPAGLAAACFAVIAALYLSGAEALYRRVLITWGVDAFSFPFLDTDTVMSALRCRRMGLDVFATNPCDPLGRVFDYSPLWLVLARLPVTRAWTMPAGLAVDIAFLASLLLLPAGRTREDTARIIIGVLSPAAALAVERGNNDLVLFALAAAAAALAGRAPALRLLGYAAALLAGLLKYYPMTLMALATRERPGRFVAVALASVAVAGLFLAVMGDELARALRLIPVGSPFLFMFGASALPRGLGALFGWPAVAVHALQILLTLAAFGTGIGLGLSRGGPAVARLAPGERDCLLAGALLMIGCYFTAQNIAYRAVHLVLVLPALTALWRTGGGRLWPAATYAALVLLWVRCWRAVLNDQAPGALYAGWAVQEALWWFVLTVLIGLVAAILADTAMARAVMRKQVRA